MKPTTKRRKVSVTENHPLLRPHHTSHADPVTAARRDRRDKAFARLVHKFPTVAQCHPLALDTPAKLRRVGFTKSQVNDALYRLTHKTKYLKALAAEGSQRHDLFGNVVEPVSTEHRQYAREQIRARRNSWDRKRKPRD
jgi:sRNA-binding protein